MIAFEVKLNGKRVCIAGAEDLIVLATGITAVGKLGPKTANDGPAGYDIDFRIGGMTRRRDPSKDVHVRWKASPALRIGDVVQVRLVEVKKADRPKSRRNAARRRAQRKKQ